jgi:hypothetical protein
MPIPVAARSKRGSAAARLLGFRVQIPPKTWMFVSWLCHVLISRDLRGADHSSGRVLPSEVRLSVMWKPLWKGLGPFGLSSNGKKSVDIMQIDDTVILYSQYLYHGVTQNLRRDPLKKKKNSTIEKFKNCYQKEHKILSSFYLYK